MTISGTKSIGRFRTPGDRWQVEITHYINFLAGTKLTNELCQGVIGRGGVGRGPIRNKTVDIKRGEVKREGIGQGSGNRVCRYMLMDINTYAMLGYPPFCVVAKKVVVWNGNKNYLGYEEGDGSQ